MKTHRHAPLHPLPRPACIAALLLSTGGCAIPGPRPGAPPLPSCSRTPASARIGIQRGAGPDLPALVSAQYGFTILCRDENDEVVTAGGTFVDHQLSGAGFSPSVPPGVHDVRSTQSDLSFVLDGPLQGQWCVHGQVELAGQQTIFFRYGVAEQVDPPTNLQVAPAFLQRSPTGMLEVVAPGSFTDCF